MAEFVERSGSYVVRGPGRIYAGRAENVLLARRWVRLLQAREEKIRRAMHAGLQDDVHAILERVEAAARGVAEERGGASGRDQLLLNQSDRQTTTPPERGWRHP